jgi:hypothetical protein
VLPDGAVGSARAVVNVAFVGSGGERSSGEFPVDAARAGRIELGKCAVLRAETPAGERLAASRFRDGSRVQAPGGRLCQPAEFVYTQLVGPFPITSCGDWKVRAADGSPGD